MFAEKMKGSGFIAITLVVAMQIFLFVVTWNWLVGVAAESGREQRGGVVFGVTVFYGAIFLGFIFLIASVVSAIARRRLTRWLVLVGLLAGWCAWVLPALSSYPIRGSVYLSLGALILIMGSGIVLPILSQALERVMGGGEQPNSEQDVTPNR